MSIVNKALAAKILIPQLGNTHVYRERLTDILHNNIQKRLQVISAPAGYGKTTLLSDFVHNIGIPVCWYSISMEDEEDPKLLIEGILASIKSQFPNFGKLTTSWLASMYDISKDAPHLLTILANEINDSIPDYLVFVLEDYHLIQHSQSAKYLLNLFVNRLPDNCHLIISSRTQVELPIISSMLLNNQVTILSMSHLSFTAAEAKRLSATCFGRNLTNGDANKLVEETGGWAISLVLHLNNIDTNESFDHSIITQDQVFRYMTVEVFEKQLPDIQNFLLASSTIDDMEFELIEQLIPGVNYHKIMNYLTQQNLFLQCVNKEIECYRYHQLFKDFLQDKLRRDDSTEFRLLHYKAALLYERERNWIVAITHYQKSQKYREIVRIIKDVGPSLHKAGKWTVIQRWFNILPVNLKSSDPELVLLDAKCLIHLGNTDKAKELLTGLLNRPLGEADWLLKSETLSWLGAVYRLSGYFREAKNHVSNAVSLLEEHHGPVELLGAYHRRLGDIYKDQGQFFSALKHLRIAQKYYTTVFDISALAIVHNSLGVTYKRLGQLTRAKMHFEKARVGWMKVDNPGELAATLNNIGTIYQRFGQYDLALDVYNSGLEKARQTGYLRIEAVIKISIADTLRDLSRFDNALENYNEGIELARETMEATFIAYGTAGVGETYRLLGQYDKARTLLEEARHQAEDQKQLYETALFDIQLGIIDYETGQLELAKTKLSSAGKQLQTMGDRDALATVYFHLAQVSFLSREYTLAKEWLIKTSRLADELGYENFMIVEGKKTLPLIHYGVTIGIGNGRFVRLLEKIRALNETKQTQETNGLLISPNSKTEHDVEVRALGLTEVTVNHQQVTDVDWRSSRAKEIFFYLLTYPGGRTKEQITAALWPDLSPAKGSSNFHINLFRARRALFPGIFSLEDGKYRINSDLRVWFDVSEFERLVAIADKHPQDGNENTALERAVELYAGPFLTEFYTEWVEIRRRELEYTYLKILSLLANIHAKKGNINRAVTLLEKSIAIDPYQEENYYRIMRLYLERENTLLARRVYQQYINSLAGEKELDVSPEIKELFQKLVVREAS
jgi:LuxR family transcriptional regulator, maltose regulon positive regulatory protein